MLCLLAEAVGHGIPYVEAVLVGRSAHVLAGMLQGGLHLVVGGCQVVIGHCLQGFYVLYLQLFHQRLAQLLAVSGAVCHQAAQDAAHVDPLGEQAVRRRGLEQSGDFGAAAGLSEDGHVLRVSAEASDVVMNPLQGGHQVVGACVAGVGVLLPERGQVAVAQDVEPVVHGDHHHLAQLAHVLALIGNLLDGGSCEEPAAVEPYHDRALLCVQARAPDVQVLAVLVHDPVAMGHHQLAAGLAQVHKGAHIAVAGSLEHALRFFTLVTFM